MANNYTEAIGQTLKNEGGLNKKEIGRGGVSNFGITQQTLDNYNATHGFPHEDVSTIKKDKAQVIYLEDFYQKPGYNRLPKPIGNQMFDFGVQSGPGTATKALQRAVGANPDGILGPKTEKAVNSFIKNNGENALIDAILDERQYLIDRLTKGSVKYSDIKKGLDNRIKRMRALKE